VERDRKRHRAVNGGCANENSGKDARSMTCVLLSILRQPFGYKSPAAPSKSKLQDF
jgi:hypothetical protein